MANSGVGSARGPSNIGVALVAALAAALLAGGCGGSGSEPSPEPQSVDSFLTGAATTGSSPVQATSHDTSPPAPSGGPTATVIGLQSSDTSERAILVEGSAPFDRLYINLAPVEITRTAPDDRPELATLLAELLEAPVRAATVQPTGFLQIDLASPVLRVSLAVRLASDVPITNFEIQVYLSSNGAVGQPSRISNSGGFNNVTIVGIVFAQCLRNEHGPCTYVNPVVGGTVSTSLDDRTAITDSQGEFELVTDTRYGPNLCFTLSVSAPGLPGYSQPGWSNANVATAGVVISMSPPYPFLPGC